MIGDVARSLEAGARAEPPPSRWIGERRSGTHAIIRGRHGGRGPGLGGGDGAPSSFASRFRRMPPRGRHEALNFISRPGSFFQKQGERRILQTLSNDELRELVGEGRKRHWCTGETARGGGLGVEASGEPPEFVLGEGILKQGAEPSEVDPLTGPRSLPRAIPPRSSVDVAALNAKLRFLASVCADAKSVASSRSTKANSSSPCVARSVQ